MWFVRFLTSSIGKKLIMATTGLLLFLFLCTHVAGNATIFMSSEVFQSYADELHSHPLIVIVFSIAILLLFLAHIIVGLFLFFQNREVSNSRYAVSTRVVKNSFASETMPYTGLFILAFLFVHIFGFTFSPKETLISVTVKELLSNFFYALFYPVSKLTLAASNSPEPRFLEYAPDFWHQPPTLQYSDCQAHYSHPTVFSADLWRDSCLFHDRSRRILLMPFKNEWLQFE